MKKQEKQPTFHIENGSQT